MTVTHGTSPKLIIQVILLRKVRVAKLLSTVVCHYVVNRLCSIWQILECI